MILDSKNHLKKSRQHYNRYDIQDLKINYVLTSKK